MNSFSNDDIIDKFQESLIVFDSKEDLEFDKRMISYRFLSEIEKLAEEKKFSRKVLAKKVGTSASFITQLFRGNKIINMENVALFQKVFDVTFEVKALPNKAKDEFLNFDVDSFLENRKEVSGFWAFHKFDPDYDAPKKVVITGNSPNDKTSKLIA